MSVQRVRRGKGKWEINRVEPVLGGLAVEPIGWVIYDAKDGCWYPYFADWKEDKAEWNRHAKGYTSVDESVCVILDHLGIRL